MNESVRRICQEIEGAEFRSSVSIASSRRLFEKFVVENETFRRLQAAVSADLHSLLDVVNRARSLAALDVDSRYENPNDIAISAMLLAAYGAHAKLGKSLAAEVAMTPNAWWAIQIASLLLADRDRAPSSHLVVEANSKSRLNPRSDSIDEFGVWTGRDVQQWVGVPSFAGAHSRSGESHGSLVASRESPTAHSLTQQLIWGAAA